MIITDYFNFDAPVEIISVYDAIDIYMSQNPDSDIETLELEFDGARFKFEILGVGDDMRYCFDINAATKTVLKNESSPLKTKYQGGVRRERKKVNVTDLISIEEATKIGTSHTQGFRPFEWKLERKGDLTVWEIEYIDGQGDKEMELKINAQNGNMVEIEFPR